MPTSNRNINTDHDREMLIRFIESKRPPYVVSITDGKHRSTAQNRLQMLWMNEISQQKGDMTPSEVRAYCKLTIGVPILRAQNEAFRIRYDEVLKPLSYEQKIAIMGDPLDLPVTRLMSTKQKTEYLDGIARHFGEQGIILTMPEDMRNEIYSNPDEIPSSDDAGMSPASEAGGDAPSELPASSISEEREWLQTAAKMLWSATNVTGNADANLDTLNNQRKAVGALMPPGTDQAIRDKAGSIYARCKEMVMSENEPDDVRKIIAGIAGLEPEEIGGVK